MILHKGINGRQIKIKKYIKDLPGESGKSADELAIGRNEIYARHGYIFQDAAFREHFENTSWYVGTVTGDQFDASVLNEIELANIDLIVRIENEGTDTASQQSYDFTGQYIDGTGNDYNRIVITQNGNSISYDWYMGDVYQFGGQDVPISEDGTVNIGGGGIWLEGDGTLKYNPGSGGTAMTRTFWKVNG